MATAFKPAAAALPFIHPDDMPDVYCLTGVGTCMEPLIADGTLVVFDKRQQPEACDVVCLIFTPEAARRRGMPGWIKRLAFALPPASVNGLIVVEQLNPLRQYTIPTTDVLAVHKAVGRAERLPNGQTGYRPGEGL